MNRAKSTAIWVIGVAASIAATLTACAELVINEVLFNPPGPDAPNAWIELRGTPNLVIPAGTYLVAVAGDESRGPGTIHNVFDLSGRAIGGNGFLVLLQKGNFYTPHTNATVLANSGSGAGFGSGASSSIGHSGDNGQTDLEHASVTFMLIEATNAPAPGGDIDPGNSGIPHGPDFAGWRVMDSVGVLGAHGVGDFAYGAINFRRDSAPGNGATASGTIVPVSFTPSYVGRSGNSTGSAAAAWVAGDALGGSAPNWVLGAAPNTWPAASAGAPLNHLGAPNFGAPGIPGVVLAQTGGGTEISEAGGTDSFTLALNTSAAGPVTLQVACGPQLEVSADGGPFGPTASVTLTNTAPQAVSVRAVDDNVIDASPHTRFITNRISATGDPAQYPLTALVPMVKVGIVENDSTVLSELKVNPPGTDDAPCEFIEIAGPPGAGFTNVYLLVVEGDIGANPGRVNLARNLAGASLGGGGLLVAASTNHPYALPPGTALIGVPELSQPGGALGNGTISVLLVSSASPILQGADLDNGDNGVMEGLPPGALILDSVGWRDADQNDIVYGGVDLRLPAGTPDAATRIAGDNRPRTAAAWGAGELVGSSCDSLAYDSSLPSTNLPAGTLLTPGSRNNTAPTVGPIVPVSGVIGDPWNPSIPFTVSDRETPASLLTVSATSDNQAVAPNTNLVVTAAGNGAFSLLIAPVGVGYAGITLWVSDGSMTGRVTFPYAASAPGRSNGVWHIGASDGSTAIALDADYMFIGDDENQTLRLCRRQQSGLPLAQFDMGPFLNLPDVEAGQVREVDIEASTRVGNRIYWMGSHSHANIGETRTNRTRIFATSLSGTGAASALAYVGHYSYLKADLIEWDRLNLHGKGANYYGLEASDAEGVPPKSPDGSGFSIEGLAMMPGSTNGAYVAFRAPIVPAADRNYALIVPVLNFAALAAGGGPPGSCTFGAPIELDLYGRGIRSLEGNAGEYLIVAGPAAAGTAEYPRDFRLYTWTGNPADLPRERAADLSGLAPEGIVELPPGPWTSNTVVHLLTDNGATVFYGDGIPAKRLPIANFKKCRSDAVTLGPVVKPMPVITSVTWQGGSLAVRWRALQNETYRLQLKTNLSQTVWTDIPGDVTAAGPYADKLVTPPGPRCYFRVRLL